MKIIHFFIYLFLYFLSLFPLSVLYILSDVLYFFLFNVFKYRKTVSFQNLKLAFPDKDERTILEIQKKYYKNISQIVVEIIKLKSMSFEDLSKRIVFVNKNYVENLYKEKRKIIAAGGHLGNWEWIAAISGGSFSHKMYMVYKPLSSKFFNDYILNLRSKFGMKCISFKQTYRQLIRLKDELNLTVIAADQTPTRSEIEYWTKFLNQDTCYYIGIEKISKSLDCSVVFIDSKRVRKGYYEVEFLEICKYPRKTEEFAIMEKYNQILENHILKYPDNWLWSHRRWKHKKLS